ncbi:hypothetical protein KP509_23G082200 [Ceratopteris richardii]|uniref:mitogen-activated protein kinase kinase kinase n=1 Tax=Ceratopteris richardii TaxID=49495 RepID=A0A8T2S471_CERRI|nr:hypothetical protein KP509_23G082200 [Ceratopteris richardii]
MIHSLFKGAKISIKPANSESDSNSSTSSGITKKNGRRLERAKNLKLLIRSDDDFSDGSRSSLTNDPSGCLVQQSLLSKTYSCNMQSESAWDDSRSSPPYLFPPPINVHERYSLPSPEFSKGTIPQQVHSPLSSPRPWLRDDGASGYSSDSASSNRSFGNAASNGALSSCIRHSEGDLEDLKRINSEMPVRATSDLRIHRISNKVHKSAPSSRHTSPVHRKSHEFIKDGPNVPKGTLRSQISAPHSTYMGPEPTSTTGVSITRYLEQSYIPSSSRLPSRLVDAHPLPLPPTFGTSASASSSPRSCTHFSQGSCIMESNVSRGKWLKGDLIGSGAFGRVYKGIHSETGEFCAIKEVEFVDNDAQSRNLVKQLVQEIALLSSLRHPNIVHYKGCEMMEGRLNIYMELVSGGSIHKLCHEFQRLEEPIIRRYTHQILSGLHYLHITLTRDIKCANILVNQEGRIKLADFGLAKQIEHGGEFLSFKGSPYWMAPEVILQKTSNFAHAVDIWSLGCTVLEMVTGKPPWSDYEGVAAMFKISRAELPPIPDSLSPEGQSFIKLCLQGNPADRPSAASLLQHPFVQFPNEGLGFKVQLLKIL